MKHPDEIAQSHGFSEVLTNKKYQLFGHILFFAVYLAYAVYCATFYRPFIPDTYINIGVWSWFLLVNICLAYLNIYFLMPRFLYRHLYTTYGICLAGCLVLMILSTTVSAHLLDLLYGTGQFLSALQSPRVVIPLSFACPMAIVLFRRQYINKMRIHRLSSVTMQSELEQLKKQINPHFLFNMLNNAIVLVKTDSVEASQVLLKFKDLLNYQLTGSAEEATLLTNDIQFLNDYLNLEKIRRDRFEFSITVEGATDGIRIPPLLFIPFVENAIKHNPESDDYLSYVRIRFRLAEGKLHFTCINAKPVEQQDAKEGGLGLANVRRRLLLLYPDNHVLNLENQSDRFQVNLQIPILNPYELYNH